MQSYWVIVTVPSYCLCVHVCAVSSQQNWVSCPFRSAHCDETEEGELEERGVQEGGRPGSGHNVKYK